MNKVRIKLNDRGIQELLKSQEMQSILREQGQAVAAQAGEGYASNVVVYTKRAVAQIYPTSAESAFDNYENNTLLKALGR